MFQPDGVLRQANGGVEFFQRAGTVRAPVGGQDQSDDGDGVGAEFGGLSPDVLRAAQNRQQVGAAQVDVFPDERFDGGTDGFAPEFGKDHCIGQPGRLDRPVVEHRGVDQPRREHREGFVIGMKEEFQFFPERRYGVAPARAVDVAEIRFARQ